MAVRARAAAALALALVAVGAESAERWALVADAGSTGTRAYLFHLALADGKVDVTDVGKGPPLSGFQDKPGRAFEAVAPQLEKAKALIPPAAHSSVPVSVFATAGMRLVPKAAQEAIYAGLRAGLVGAGAAAPYAFDAGALEARTISGREEGVFALIAANYLSKRLQTTLAVTTDSLIGVLDLGGSSTQVAAPPVVAAGDPLPAKLGREHTFVRSFLNLGMERMRQRTYQRFVEGASETQRGARAVGNPCAFYGYTEGEEVWRGTGEAASCEIAVRSALAEEQASCAVAREKEEAAECLSGKPVPIPAGPKDRAKFFLISGYLYVTDFASWTLKNREGPKPPGLESGVPPMPTIKELRAAAEAVCAQPWGSLNATALDPKTKHGFTPPKKVPHRCFEITYIVALLSAGYGFEEDARLFHIVEDIDGFELEWTLGAFLHGAARKRSAEDTPAQEL